MAFIELWAPFFALANLGLIFVHMFLISRSFRLADKTEALGASVTLPHIAGMIFDSQRRADVNAWRTMMFSGSVVLGLVLITIRNALIYLPKYL